MRYRIYLLFVLLPSFIQAQVAKDYAVLVYASYTESPANITLHWPLDANAELYKVYKKEKSETNWGAFISELPGDATELSDDDIVIDSAYEYKVVRESISGIQGFGYILTGIKLHLPDYRGKCLVVIDTTNTAGMENEIYRLMKDISGDGWSVERINVSADDAVEDVRNIIYSKYETDPDVQSVFLFGHVPVPYSGNLYPDGHPDHEGAWPADGIYGDTDGDYTDETINNTVASRIENWNVPGDGKYDQSIFNTKLELQIGRVDLSDLPVYAMTEEQLLKNYLDKDHAFRTGIITAEERGLIDDNFGAFYGEAFASNGWRNFAPMFGPDQLFEADYFTTMYNDTYLWSNGCGGGWYQGASGVGSSTDFAIDTAKTIFTLLFGSYFGDWDITDNFLRAPLGNAYTLTNAWAGRPHWQFHHMVLGENIGYSTMLTQNNQSTYLANIFPHWVHIALMGDPTLRMHVVKPVSNVHCELTTGFETTVGVFWDPSPEPDVVGYYVYRSDEEFGKFERITVDITNDIPFIDDAPIDGLNYYMVKAVKLKDTPSGSYYNLSTGMTDSVTYFGTAVEDIEPGIHFSIYPNPATSEFKITWDGLIEFESLQIYNLEGKLILSSPVLNQEMTIQVDQLSQGIYFVECGGFYRKLIIL